MKSSNFWSKVDIGGASECWEWLMYKDKDGYGLGNIDGKTVRVHRFAYVVSKGKLPDGKLVLHSCDNPSCCNPSHLSAGSEADNTHDMINKGRGRMSKLLREDVESMRLLFEEGVLSNKQIAKMYGVANNTVSMIKTGAAWAHI